jgi:hypothetical protein
VRDPIAQRDCLLQERHVLRGSEVATREIVDLARLRILSALHEAPTAALVHRNDETVAALLERRHEVVGEAGDLRGCQGNGGCVVAEIRTELVLQRIEFLVECNELVALGLR